MDQTEYIKYLRRALRKERRRTEMMQDANIVISLVAVALLVMLAIATNLP